MENIRAPDVKEEAKQDYLSGMKYKELAEKYEVSINTIKSWVKRYGWAKEKNKKGAHKTKKRGAPYNNKNAVGNKGGGAPLGNKNAVGNSGGGAPKGNKNAVTTGEFERLFFSDLSDEEKQLIQSIEYEKKVLLRQEIALLTVREKRILQRIEEAKKKTGGLSIKDVTTRKAEITGSLLSGKQNQNETITHALSTFELISRLEEALTRIQAKKIKCIDSLNKIEVDEKKLQLEERKLTGETEQDKLIDDWIDSVIGDEDE